MADSTGTQKYCTVESRLSQYNKKRVLDTHIMSAQLTSLSFSLSLSPSSLARVLVRAVSYTIHGLIPASCVFADRYNREEVVASLGREINLNPPLTLGQLPDTSEELLKLDQVSQRQE